MVTAGIRHDAFRMTCRLGTWILFRGYGLLATRNTPHDREPTPPYCRRRCGGKYERLNRPEDSPRRVREPIRNYGVRDAQIGTGAMPGDRTDRPRASCRGKKPPRRPPDIHSLSPSHLIAPGTERDSGLHRGNRLPIGAESAVTSFGADPKLPRRSLNR
jgi:hypothetical protein